MLLMELDDDDDDVSFAKIPPFGIWMLVDIEW